MDKTRQQSIRLGAISACGPRSCCRAVGKWGHLMPVHEQVHDPDCVNYARAAEAGGEGTTEDAPTFEPGAEEEQTGDNCLHQFAQCQECLNAQFQYVLGQVQANLHHMTGNDQETIQRAAGHSQGPKCKWVNVAGEPTSDRCRPTVVSRAWCISACWLRTVLTAKSVTEVQAAKCRILFCSIDGRTKDERLKDGIREFEAWRACITRVALNHSQWVKIFYKAAIKMQRLAEDQAAAFAAEAFSSWLHEGPMDGLRRQHQLSRTADG